MNVNDQMVIDHVKNNGNLVDLESWSIYSAEYTDPQGDLEDHLKHCKPIEGNLTLVEESQSVFEGTFDENNQTLTLEVHGIECECGEYDNLGYTLTKSLSETVQDILQENGIDVTVSAK